MPFPHEAIVGRAFTSALVDAYPHHSWPSVPRIASGGKVSVPKFTPKNLKSLKFYYGIDAIVQFSLYVDVILLIMSDKWKISNYRMWVWGVILVTFNVSTHLILWGNFSWYDLLINERKLHDVCSTSNLVHPPFINKGFKGRSRRWSP